jgi:hypothetical protein
MSNENFRRAVNIESAVRRQKEFWNVRRSLLDSWINGEAFGPFQVQPNNHPTKSKSSKKTYHLQGNNTQLAGLGLGDEVQIVDKQGNFIGKGTVGRGSLSADYLLPSTIFLLRTRVFSATPDYSDLPDWPDPQKLFSNAQSAHVPAQYLAGLDQASIRAFAGVAGKNHFFGVKGPPGTGKTSLLGRIVAYLVGELGQKVLIVANAHKAVDEALLATLQARDTFGHNFDVVKKMSDRTRFKRSQLHGKCILWTGKSFDLANSGGCVVGAVMASTFHNQRYDTVIVDEAGQIPIFSAAKLAGLSDAFAFFGDDSQLPPILEAQHEEEVSQSCLSYLMRHDPQRSLVVELEVTHRLNKALCRTVGTFFYPEIDFRASPQNADSYFVPPVGFPAPQGLGWIGIANQHSSNSNHEEVDKVAELVKALKDQPAQFDRQLQKIASDDIAVLTPFKVQERLLAEKLEPLGVRTIGTVDIMQGQSKAIVIFCLTATNPHYIAACSQWLFEPNRLNVGISRAKSGCYMIANRQILDEVVPSSALGMTRLEHAKKLLDAFIAPGG